MHHLADVLTKIDELASGREDLYLVRLAAWFHDAVYAIPAGQVSNEEASARLAIRMLSRAGFEQEDLTQVARLVRLTETHVPGARDPEGELLCDADLAILAAEPGGVRPLCRADPGGVRLGAGASSSWPAGCAVLSALADRELFRTGKGRRLTAAARANLEREMQDLIERLGPVEGSIP